mmetsp:Transcript_1774/g.3961  ORF Transcript_1774/g.3961 Transcript_1774/m.3961 type:complete len:154 (+) Transcript_1774:359-820(+)
MQQKPSCAHLQWQASPLALKRAAGCKPTGVRGGWRKNTRSLAESPTKPNLLGAWQGAGTRQGRELLDAASAPKKAATQITSPHEGLDTTSQRQAFRCILCQISSLMPVGANPDAPLGGKLSTGFLLTATFRGVLGLATNCRRTTEVSVDEGST